MCFDVHFLFSVNCKPVCHDETPKTTLKVRKANKKSFFNGPAGGEGGKRRAIKEKKCIFFRRPLSSRGG